MERILQVAPIVDTVWKDGAVSVRSGGAMEFNAGGLPNRSAAIITGETYVFDADADHAEYWSTRDIIEYLLFYHLPTSTGEVDTIPWELTNKTVVPNWDTPTIDPEGQTIYSLINELIGPRQLLGWAVAFDNTDLLVAPFSIAASNITLADVTFLANATQHDFFYGSDPLTRGEITIDRSDMVDQVIVRGARRQSVCTLRYDEDQLYRGWTGTQETDYRTGASGETGYSTSDAYTKREANERVRRQKFSDVYSKFILADTWDYTVADGLDTERVFEPVDDADTDPYEPFRGAVRIENYLPLQRGIDYVGDLSLVGPSNGTAFREPLITLAKPGTTTLKVDVTQIGESLKHLSNNEVIDFTVDARVDDTGKAIRLRVNGAPQYAIAGSTYTLTDDDTAATGSWVMASLAATVCITEDRYCEFTQPETPPTADVVRRRVIHVGDQYQKIYIVPGTVVRLDWDGSEMASDGGYMRDDTDKLEYLAKLLASYHTSPRTSMSLTTYRRTGLCNVGDLVASADGTTIGAVISQIRIDAPMGDGENTPMATQTIIATSSPIDLLSTLSLASGTRRWMRR